MKPLTQILSEIRKRCEAATPEQLGNIGNRPELRAAIEFYESARIDVPRLVNALEETVGLLFKWTNIEDNESVNTDLIRIARLLSGEEE